MMRDDATPFSEPDRALLAYAAELTRTGHAGDSTAAALKAHFDDRRIVELTITVAFYNCVARVLTGLAVDLEAGMQPLPR